MRLKKIEGLWVLFKGSEIVEAHETREEGELALFDATRRWTSLWDTETRR